MSTLAPLPMSQTKDDLLRHLNMGLETYALMAKETDRVYKWLTSGKHHLKKNCKRKPPYDWSDIVEKSKDEAIKFIAQSGDAHTSYYWNLAGPSEDSQNWIAKWFLYHKFRYRDGRNRNLVKGEDGRQAYSSSSSHSHHKHGGSGEQSSGYYDGQMLSYPPGSTTSGQDSQGYAYSAAASTTAASGWSTYASAETYDTRTQTYADQLQDSEPNSKYWDPVRDH